MARRRTTARTANRLEGHDTGQLPRRRGAHVGEDVGADGADRRGDRRGAVDRGGGGRRHRRYAMIVQCNEMVIEVDGEIEAIAKSVRGTYARRFPELESLIPNPLDYARVVLCGTETDLTQVDPRIPPSASIMVVTVTASMTAGQPLPSRCSARSPTSASRSSGSPTTRARCSRSSRAGWASSRPTSRRSSARRWAPSSSAPPAACRSSPTCRAPCCRSGSKKRNLQGGSVAGAQAAASVVAHAGFIGQADLVQNTPPALRMKAARILAGKCTLAARIDAYQNAGDGNAAAGQHWRDEITKKITKLLEPPPPKVAKALPVPPEASGKRRGGRRIRKMKERLGQSQKTALMNRVQFGVEEDTTSDGLLGVGMLTKGQQNGKVRVSSKEQKLLAEKNKKARTGASSGASNGLASSLAFTPVQGIELVNPSANRDSSEGTETYFSKQAAFFAGGDAGKS